MCHLKQGTLVYRIGFSKASASEPRRANQSSSDRVIASRKWCSLADKNPLLGRFSVRPPSASREAPGFGPGEDLGGLTALLLLTSRATGPALFLLSAVDAVVSVDRDRHQFRRLRLTLDTLPIPAASIAALVVDVDRIAGGQRLRRAALREITRVLAPGGRCVIVTAHRRIPRDVRKWREYHLARPDRDWLKLLYSQSELVICQITAAKINGARVTEVAPPRDAPAHALTGNDRTIIVLRRESEIDDEPPIRKLVAQARRALGTIDTPICLEQFLVRKIGKTTLIVAAGNERRYVMRVPRSPMAEERSRQNFAMLSGLHTDRRIPACVKEIVPHPHGQGMIDGYRYYLEDALPGKGRDEHANWRARGGWEAGALRFVSELHLATKQQVCVDNHVFDRIVAAPLARILERCPNHAAALAKLGTALERRLKFEVLPFVWAHGDFAAGNCLYDNSRRLTGVVDWELSSPCQLPLLDVLHCMEVPNESTPSSTWQRFELVHRVLQPDKAASTPALAAYVGAVGIPSRLLPAFSALYWIDHVGVRIDGRWDDAPWMTRRVLQPLAILQDELQ